MHGRALSLSLSFSHSLTLSLSLSVLAQWTRKQVKNSRGADRGRHLWGRGSEPATVVDRSHRVSSSGCWWWWWETVSLPLRGPLTQPANTHRKPRITITACTQNRGRFFGASTQRGKEEGGRRWRGGRSSWCRAFELNRGFNDLTKSALLASAFTAWGPVTLPR